MRRAGTVPLWSLAVCCAMAIAPAALAQRDARVPAAVTAFRVCADPNNLPFSNEKGEGFENRIAERLASDLGLPLQYTWKPQRRGFVRTTLNAGECDVIMGVPNSYDMVQTSRPYYHSTYVFVYRRDRGYHITSLADSALRRLKIGIHVIGDAAIMGGMPKSASAESSDCRNSRDPLRSTSTCI